MRQSKVCAERAIKNSHKQADNKQNALAKTNRGGDKLDRKREGECRQTRMLFGVAVCVAIIMRKLTMQLAL